MCTGSYLLIETGGAVLGTTMSSPAESNASNTTGAVIAFVASFISVLGTNTQKNSHLKEARRPAGQRPYWRRPQWWVGLGCVVFGAIGDFAALGFASQAMVAALGGATTLVGNVIIANKWNKEPLFKTDLAGLCFVLLGAFTFAVTTPPSANWTLAQLRARFVSAEFLSYAAVNVAVGALLLGTIASSQFYKWRTRATLAAMAPLVDKVDAVLEAQTEWIANLEARLDEMAARGSVAEVGTHTPRGDGGTHGMGGVGGGRLGGGSASSAGDRMGVSTHSLRQEVRVVSGTEAYALLQKRLAEIEAARRREAEALRPVGSDGASGAHQPPLRQQQSLLGGLLGNRSGGGASWADQYVYASCAGCIGAMSVLFASCVAKLVMETLNGNNQFTTLSPVPYVFIALMLCTITAQTHLLNEALVMGDSMSVFPVFQVFWIGFSVIGGVVFYDSGAVSLAGVVFFVVGCAFLVQHGKRKYEAARGIGAGAAVPGRRGVGWDEELDPRAIQMDERLISGSAADAGRGLLDGVIHDYVDDDDGRGGDDDDDDDDGGIFGVFPGRTGGETII